MAVLKKIPAGTLLETIVATVLLVLVFGMAMMLISRVLKSTFEKEDSKVQYEINKLVYHVQHKKKAVPYREDFRHFRITIASANGDLVFKATSLTSARVLVLKKIRDVVEK